MSAPVEAVHGQLENIIYSYAGTLMHGSTEQRSEAMATIMSVADGLMAAERERILCRLEDLGDDLRSDITAAAADIRDGAP